MTSAREVLDSTTGFEELAVEKATGKSLETWSYANRDLVVLRICAAIKKCREGDDGKTPLPARMKAAWDAIQAMPKSEIEASFEDEEDESFEDDPVTPVGKDGVRPDGELATSPDSVSPPE